MKEEEEEEGPAISTEQSVHNKYYTGKHKSMQSLRYITHANTRAVGVHEMLHMHV